MKKKENYENYPNIRQEEKEQMKIKFVEKQLEPVIKQIIIGNQLKQIRKQAKKVKSLKIIYLIIKFLSIVLFASILLIKIKCSFKLSKSKIFPKQKQETKLLL